MSRTQGPTDRTKRIVWVLAGGRCCLCKAKVIDDTIDPVPLGEVAHAAGHGSDPETTPRYVEDMDAEAKRHPDNLLLLCTECHKKVDDKTISKVYDLETLISVKMEHEKLVEELLSLMESNQSIVLRALAKVRAKDVGLERPEVAAALARRGRRPVYLEGRHRPEVEVDLSVLDEDTDGYWTACRQKLVSEVARVLDARAEGVAPHIAVFAWMRTPLLVLLGWLLDDTTRVDVIQRSRLTAWMPDAITEVHQFEAKIEQGGAEADEVVLVLSLSGPAPTELLPEELQALPQVRISSTSGYDTTCLDNVASQHAFDQVLSKALGLIEGVTPRPQTVHVICGAPIYACVQVGRKFQPEITPRVIAYDAAPGEHHRPALHLNEQDRP